MHSNDSRYQILLKLQRNPENIRNISIIAHVDHGKTTLSDSLISSNNIISKKLVGKLRYLDSRLDEQERQITMKSSSISLIYNSEEDNKEYLINLIDSPGHVEFSSEVSSALRLTDGALILVDVLEGVSTQTYGVIKQAFQEKVKTILVLNKVDRLFNELDMSPLDVYKQLAIIIEQINAILSTLIAEDINKEAENPSNINKPVLNADGISLDDDFLDKIEDKMYFSPEKGNVIFCSAVDNWAFSIQDFSKIFSQKLKCNPKFLQKFLWGDYYLNPKNKKVYNNPQNDKHKPMFVEFILTNIWNIYEKVKLLDIPKIESIAKSLGVELPLRYKEILNKDPNIILVYLMNKWLPMDKNILKVVAQLVPNPREAQKYRLASICKKIYKAGYDNEEGIKLKEAIENCKGTEEYPTTVFISKMIAIPQENINEHGLNEYDNKAKIKFIGFARVFSGVLKRGMKIFVIGPKAKGHNASKTNNKENLHIEEVQVNNIYVLMAQYLEGVKEVCAGNIVGIGNLDDVVFKTSTLSTLQTCPSFSPIMLKSTALLKVSLKTQTLEDYPKLIDGLKKLNKSDPSLEVYAQENGDVILATCGEVHLERCIRDLEDTLAKVKIIVSEPLVSFRESVIYQNIIEVNNPKKNEKILENQKKQEYEDRKENEKEEEEEKKKDYGENAEIIILADEKPEKDEMRFNEENSRKKQEQKEAFLKQVSQMPKKIDKKNKAKSLKKVNKMNLINLNKKSNVFETFTPNKKFMLTVRAIGLNFEFAQYLEKSSNTMRKLFYDFENKHHNTVDFNSFFKEMLGKMKEFDIDEKLIELVKSSLISFGPKRYGPNLLLIKGLNQADSLFAINSKPDVLNETEEMPCEDEKTNKSSSNSTKIKIKNSEHSAIINTYFNKMTALEINKAIIAGFEMSVSSGPLCEEPMMGVCFIVESFRPAPIEDSILNTSKDEGSNELKSSENEEILSTNEGFKDLYGPLSGQIMSAMKEACLQSFLGALPRLVEGVYQCHLLTDTQFYGKSYEVLNKRRATILNENLNENSNIFSILAHLPIHESFGFYSEILDKTSGRVNAQLTFDTWKVIEVDPFFCPQTEEELEEFGEQGVNLPNIARILIDKIRKRKGILTEEKLVVAAEKQRTLSKKK